MTIIPYEKPFDGSTKSTSISNKNSSSKDKTMDPCLASDLEKALGGNEEDQNKDDGIHRSELKRKVKKSLRKEKRATNTLGIVVGTFFLENIV